ncbi:MAG: cobaltochelatase subunit CobN, partial [Shewanella sp.]
MFQINLSTLFALLLCLCVFMGKSVAAQQAPRISLLLGDSAQAQSIAVIKQLRAEFNQLADSNIHVYSSTNLSENDAIQLSQSDLIIIQVIGRNLIEKVQQPVKQAINNGAKVYAFGNSVNDADRNIGIMEDETLQRYFSNADSSNIRNGLLYALNKIGVAIAYQPAANLPEIGIYNAHSKLLYTDFDHFKRNYQHYKPEQPWVGFVVYKSNIIAGSTSHIDAVIAALEKRNLNVLTVFGYPAQRPIQEYFFDEKGVSRVDLVIAASVKIGVTPEILTPIFQRLNVPVINAISLFSSSIDEWQASTIGMDITERSWQLAMPEMVGLIQPTVFAAKTSVTDPESGLTYVEEQPIPERVEMLADRAKRWVTLRHTANAEKRIFLQYFNFPPGRENVGAAYLNVLPESIWQVLKRLEQEGYGLQDLPKDASLLRQDILQFGSNLPNWEQGHIDKLAQSGEPVLLPISTYQKWFLELPESAQEMITNTWGSPEQSSPMTYNDAAGNGYFVLPVRQYGNILLGPQPSRGKTEHPEKLYHDLEFPPSHQYVAFYLWLHRVFKADAIFQFGTHGTHEWLPGREAGMGITDAPEYLIRDLPNFYSFIMDNAGEGTIAMRRGMGIMITHLTPPMDRSALNPELQQLNELLEDYYRARQHNPQQATSHAEAILDLSEKLGILKDLGIESVAATPDITPKEDDAQRIDSIHHYLEEISDRINPMGLHSFGVSPTHEQINKTAQAILSVEAKQEGPDYQARLAQLSAAISQSAKQELDSLIAGFSGHYIPAAVGGDPLRNPDALPTGRNFYSFDPRRLPTKSTYELGKKLANQLLDDYKHRHHDYPNKLTFTLWGVETMRNEGVQEAQIMYLLGIRPRYDERGIVRGVEAIPREELGRPRIDVTVIPSGLHRDLFSNVVTLLDEAFSLAQAQTEADNPLRINTQKTKQLLIGKGISPDLAARMAAVRLFSVPSGAYGTNLESAIGRSDTWENEQSLTDMYFKRMGHLYGQGFWGETSPDEMQATTEVGQLLLKNALSGTAITVHARSSHVFQVLDGDDPFASFGGVSMAVRAVDGKSPEVMISHLANPNQA